MSTATNDVCHQCDGAYITHSDTNMCDECHEFWEEIESYRKQDEERTARRLRRQEARLAGNYEEQPQAGGFLIMHARATDYVFFGPFPDIDAVTKWMEDVGYDAGVCGPVVPLMNPHQDPRDFWWVPSNTPWQDLLLPRAQRNNL